MVTISEPELETLSRTYDIEKITFGPKFPKIKDNTEIQLRYNKLLQFRNTDFMVLDSKKTNLYDMFSIGGTPDSLYIPEKTRFIPIMLPNIWNDLFRYENHRITSIVRRDNIRDIRILPVSSDPLMSWESVAIAFRSLLGDEKMNGENLRILLANEWEKLLKKLRANWPGSRNWIQIASQINKEKREVTESDLIDPTLFVRSLKSGLIYPGITDFIILLQKTPITSHIAFLHSFSPGKTMSDVRHSVVVLGGPSDNWKDGIYSFIVRKKDMINSDRVLYSTLVGIRINDLPYVGSFVLNSSQIRPAMKEKIENSTKSDESWKNVRVTNWAEKFILRTK